MADIIENEGFGNDLVSVVDENGVQHTFEELDRIETDEGRFIALLPVYSEAQDIIDDDGELIHGQFFPLKALHSQKIQDNHRFRN